MKKKDFKFEWLCALVAAFVAIGFVGFASLAGVSTAQAATLGITVSNPLPEIGQLVRIDLPFDTQGDNANAIQGQILFPASQFSLGAVSDGASPVIFWIEAPQEIASGVVAFSGIMPNGFRGVASSVVSIWLLPTASGVGSVSLGDVVVLRNDGNATPITTATGTAEIVVSPIVASSTPANPVSLVAPQPFTPIISQNQNVFNGEYFLVFSTADKGSGIAYYQVLEVPSGGSGGANANTWQTATSPYLLQDQSLSSNIYVRAVDNAGNFIVVEVPAQHSANFISKQYGGLSIIWIIVFIIVLFIILLFLVIWRRRRRL